VFWGQATITSLPGEPATDAGALVGSTVVVVVVAGEDGDPEPADPEPPEPPEPGDGVGTGPADAGRVTVASVAPPAPMSSRVPLTVDGSDPADAGAMRWARTAIPSTGTIWSADPSAKAIFTDATSLPTRTATHHTGPPSATPKAPEDTSCGSDAAGAVGVVGMVVVVVVVPPGGSVVSVEAGGSAVCAGVSGTAGSGAIVPVPVEPDPVDPSPVDPDPVDPDPTGLAGHNEVESAPCPTALSSDSSMLTVDPTGTGPEPAGGTVVVVGGATVVELAAPLCPDAFPCATGPQPDMVGAGST